MCRIKIYSILPTILLLLLIGCTRVDEGIVFEKKFKKTAIGYKDIRKTIRYSRKRVSTVTENHKVRYPNHWMIYVHTKNEAKDTAFFFVSKEYYDQIQIGDKFVFDKTKAKREVPYTIIK